MLSPSLPLFLKANISMEPTGLSICGQKNNLHKKRLILFITSLPYNIVANYAMQIQNQEERKQWRLKTLGILLHTRIIPFALLPREIQTRGLGTRVNPCKEHGGKHLRRRWDQRHHSIRTLPQPFPTNHKEEKPKNLKWRNFILFF